MSAILLKGKEVADKITDSIKNEVERLSGGAPGPPVLGVIQIGRYKDAGLYAKSILRIMSRLGIQVDHEIWDDQISQDNASQKIIELSAQPRITGLLLLSPLPPQLNHKTLSLAISREKDVERAHTADGMFSDILPPTALSIFELIRSTGQIIEGKHAVVVGRSNIVGLPAARLLLNAHATVTICHSRTKNLRRHIEEADIVVAAVGKARLINGDWIKKGAIVIDAAENIVDGRLVGDVEFEKAVYRAAYLTPVPSGVGPLTTYMLAKNILSLHKLTLNKE